MIGWRGDHSIQKDKSGDDLFWISIVVVSVGVMQCSLKFSESCIWNWPLCCGSDMYYSIHFVYHLSLCKNNRYRSVMSVTTQNRFWFFSVKLEAQSGILCMYGRADSKYNSKVIIVDSKSIMTLMTAKNCDSQKNEA